jgi:DNA-binding transcriptional LysR family regulator
MTRKIDWENQIGRRLKLRDLHVFFSVVQRGSMAKAAIQLGVSQPAVSEVISDLEHTLGVRLLDRSPRGVEPTTYGRALLKRATVAFDELKQSIRDIEFLSDPSIGEVHLGCAEATASGLLPPFLMHFMKQYPRVTAHVRPMATPTLEVAALRDRSLDFILARFRGPPDGEHDDLDIETLFDDTLVIAAGVQNRWTARRTIELAELLGEPWILTPPNTWNSLILAEAFRAQGLEMPKPCLVSFSVHLRANMLERGPFIAPFPASIMRLNASEFALKTLPVELPKQAWPVSIVTLKNRTLTPVAQLFIDQLRAFTRAAAAEETQRARATG